MIEGQIFQKKAKTSQIFQQHKGGKWKSWPNAVNWDTKHCTISMGLLYKLGSAAWMSSIFYANKLKEY